MLITAVVAEEAGDQLENTATFGFVDLNPDFVVSLQKAGLYAGSTGIENAALSYFDVLTLGRAISRCAPGEVDCILDNFTKSNGGPLHVLHRSDRRTKFSQAMKIWSKGSLRSIQPTAPESVRWHVDSN